MKKILILANDDNSLYNFRKELIIELLKTFAVTISCPYGEKVESMIKLGCEYDEVSVDRRSMNPLKDYKLYKQYKKQFKTINPDLVLTFTIKPNIYGGLVAKKYNIPYVCYITGLGSAFQKENIIKKITIKMYKSALKKVSGVFFENELNKQVFINSKIVPSEKCFCFSGAGVNLKSFIYSKPKEKNVTNFLFVGRVMKEKGIEELFQAINIIKQKYSNVTFTLIGAMEEQYSEKLDQLTKMEQISYNGFVSNVLDYVIETDCLILPSYHEGMSNALLEAAAVGRPLITSNINGCKEAVIDNKSGFLCDVKSTESLVDCIEKFLKLSFEERVQFGEIARAHVEKNFDRNVVVSKQIEQINIFLVK